MSFSTRPEAAPGSAAEGNEALSGLLRTLHELDGDEALTAQLVREFADLRVKLPGEIIDPDATEPLDPTSLSSLKGVVEQARELLLARLAAEGH
ncbi:MAG: hypothetical protein FJ125_17135 [Deltaproteobacteria bacterium]|nr:hypothetical protein [Deltaproteobacteria bacterium]